MSNRSKPVYQPNSATVGAFRATKASTSPRHDQRSNSKPVINYNLQDSAIEPSLATMPRQLPYTGGMSQAEEQVFQMQLQAAAADGSDEPVTSIEQMTQDHAVKQRRSGRACDPCSKRKVKCGDEVPCKNCVDLGVPCTFVRPAKRRGPANKIAENLKRARYEINYLNTPPGTAATGAGPALAPAPTSASATAYHSLDSIALFETVHLMLYDFFTYVYPTFPFPHEHLTMDRLKKREDTQNKSFCGLVASMLAALAAVFPRLADTALGQNEQAGHVISNEVFISRCMLVCEQSRGPLTSGRDVDDAATAFFVGLVSYVRKQPRQTEMYLIESLSIVRYLGVEQDGVLADGSPADFVTKELCRRIYWAVYGLTRPSQQRGELRDILPPCKRSELPPLPLRTDDYYIYVDRIQQQPQGQLSTLEGFNLLSSLHALCHTLLSFDAIEGEYRQDYNHTESRVIKALLDVQLDAILSGGHPELASLPNPSVFEAEDPAASQQARMHIRWEIQKIMLRSALASTRLYLAQRLAVIGGDGEVLVQDTRRKCLQEMVELSSYLTRTCLEPVAKFAIPQLQDALQSLQNAATGAEDERENLKILVGRYHELFTGQ